MTKSILNSSVSKKTTKLLSAGLMAAIVATGLQIAPANAGGSFSISLLPHNSRDARALGAAMDIYSIIKSRKHRSGIRQIGRNNRAGLRQNGRGNYGRIYQKGRGHTGTLQQYGDNNSYGIYQFGRNTNANVIQRGRGQSGVSFLYGW